MEPVNTGDGELVGYTPGKPQHMRAYPAESRGPVLNHDDLKASLQRTFDRAFALAISKNERYAEPNDPFKNFRLGGQYGIAIRMTDKVVRLVNLTHPLCKVDDAGESISDTCLDIINYAALLVAMREGK